MQITNTTNAIQTAIENLKQTEDVEVCSESYIRGYFPEIADKFTEYWNVHTEIEESSNRLMSVTLIVCFHDDFPASIPDLYIDCKSYDKIKYIPHLDTKRKICTFESSAIADMDNPYGIVKEVVKRGKEILESGLQKKNFNDFELEFIAYWDELYSKGDFVIGSCITTLNEKRKHNEIIVTKFSPKLSDFQFFIHSNSEKDLRILSYAKSLNLKIESYQCFFIEQNEFSIPPFAIKNRDVIELIKSSGSSRLDDFKRYLTKNPEYPTVITKKVIDDEVYYIGWIHRKANAKVPGFRPGKYPLIRVYSSFQANQSVLRLNPKLFSQKRLEKRTTGITEDMEKALSICIAGLGSVGSNLLYFMNGLPVDSYKLIDNDNLELENVNRHLLGFSDIGSPKVVALEKYLKAQNPAIAIQPINDSVLNILEEDPNFINDADVLIVAVGKYNVERLLIEKQKTDGITIPLVILWVEPYLAGGHCLYIEPSSYIDFKSLHSDNGYFKYNVIEESEYLSKNDILNLTEAGCHTQYTPYSGVSVLTYIAAIFQRMMGFIYERPKRSKLLTWVGDLNSLKDLSIKTKGGLFSNQLIEKDL